MKSKLFIILLALVLSGVAWAAPQPVDSRIRDNNSNTRADVEAVFAG